MTTVRDQSLNWYDLEDNTNYFDCTVYVPPNIISLELITKLLETRGFKDLYMENINFAMDNRIPEYNFDTPTKPSYKQWVANH